MSIRLVDKHTDLEVTDCPTCGVDFAAPKVLLDARRRTGKTFYCPSGHPMSYTETDEQKLAKRNKALEAQLTSSRDQQRATRAQLEETQRSRSALRGVITRERNRVGRGECPCCGRTFDALRDHMAAEHPDYTSEELP